jgi:septal ring factor EnvC (AmiA/AmiB activator)
MTYKEHLDSLITELGVKNKLIAELEADEKLLCNSIQERATKIKELEARIKELETRITELSDALQEQQNVLNGLACYIQALEFLLKQLGVNPSK